MSRTIENLPLKINRLTKEQYLAAKEAGELEENELYITPDSEATFNSNLDTAQETADAALAAAQDAQVAAACVLGFENDDATDNTVYGAKAAAAAVLGTSEDDSGDVTVYGIKAAAAAVLGTSEDDSGDVTVYGIKAAAAEALGKAEEVLGDNNDTSSDYTVYGVKKYAETKLDKSNVTSKGSATNPVYFNSSGVATATTYTLGATVPSNAVFTDTTYNTGTTTISGLTKLYTGTGTNTDGTMTQNAITESITYLLRDTTRYLSLSSDDFQSSYADAYGHCRVIYNMRLVDIRFNVTYVPSSDKAAGSRIQLGSINEDFLKPSTSVALSAIQTISSATTRSWDAWIVSSGNIYIRPSSALSAGTSYSSITISGSWFV